MNARTGHAADDNSDDEKNSDDAETAAEDQDEWAGLPSRPKDAEYIDEDAYATVTVEAVDIDRDGFITYNSDDDDDEDDEENTVRRAEREKLESEKLAGEGKKRIWTKEKPKKVHKKKEKKTKFRYETKTERKITRAKERSKNSAQAKVRREKNEE
ncbi:hypothetical protein EJ08DRAFT_645967 [Tothia fuscella]|uniref:Uncharacterized protein n=1 Tax=Tothia fuscella TaxID=1048955 RepID=A0A9P4P0K2_9PEZI|nr:hypothetical protein EJ08DRAFT_645967 [Tothia fuscella]